MAIAIAFIQWPNYEGGPNGLGLFEAPLLTYSSSQERLHVLKPEDRLWLVSRHAEDNQYYFVACLTVQELKRNRAGTRIEQHFGTYSIVANPARSHNLRTRIPAEGLLRAFEFQGNRPIRFGSNLGQSLQAIRFVGAIEERVLDSTLQRILEGEGRLVEWPFGLWTKCEYVFANYFLKNWRTHKKPLAFLLYDSPPSLRPGSPVFIHSDKSLRLIATFRESQFVAGHKHTVSGEERIAERERIWLAYRNRTIDAPGKPEFDLFWERQNGVRALFLMDNLLEIGSSCQFRSYGRALEWGYPMGVGYRYLTLSQCILLLKQAKVDEDAAELYVTALLQHGREGLSK
jgi:hypothetical protein